MLFGFVIILLSYDTKYKYRNNNFIFSFLHLYQAVKKGMEDAGAIFATINKDPDTKVATPYRLLEEEVAREMVSQLIRDLSKNHINQDAKIEKKNILQKEIDQCEDLRRTLTDINMLGNNKNTIRIRAKLLFKFFGENGLSTEIIQQFKEIDLNFKDNELAKQSGLIDGSKGALSEKKRKENTNSTAAATITATSRKKQKIVKDTANDGKDGTTEKTPKKPSSAAAEDTTKKKSKKKKKEKSSANNDCKQEIEENVTEESIIHGAGSDLIRMMQDTYKELGLGRNKEAVAQIKVEGRKELMFSRISRMIANTTPTTPSPNIVDM